MALASQALALEALRRELAATRLRALESPEQDVRQPGPGPSGCWSPAALAGRLVELSSEAGAGALTWAMALAVQVQATGRPVAWVQTAAASFYPPDAAANGVALEALAVVRVLDAAAVGRAAERLARCGGFGLVALDLGRTGALPAALAGWLVQHALRHGSIVLCVTEKPARAPSLGSLVSLHARAGRRRRPEPAAAPRGPSGAPADEAGGRFVCTLRMVKDKRHGPGREEEQGCDGPPGLR